MRWLCVGLHVKGFAGSGFRVCFFMGFFLLVFQGLSCLSRDMNGFFECDKTATNFSNFPLCLRGFFFWAVLETRKRTITNGLMNTHVSVLTPQFPLCSLPT